MTDPIEQPDDSEKAPAAKFPEFYNIGDFEMRLKIDRLAHELDQISRVYDERMRAIAVAAAKEMRATEVLDAFAEEYYAWRLSIGD